MPKLSATVTTTTTVTEQVKIGPRQKVLLRKALKAYQDAHLAEKAAAAAKEKAVAEVRALREALGVSDLEFEGFSTTNVPNLRDTFDKLKFVELGGSIETYNNAVVKVPGKQYEKITCPKRSK